MVQTRLHKHSLSKAEQAVSGVASRASVRDPIDEFQDVYGSRAASAAFRQQITSDFSQSGQIQSMIQAKPSFRGLSQELAPIQAKLTVGPANDRYEQEADRVAAQVVQRIHAPVSNSSTEGQSVQRKEDEDELQLKPIAPIQRKEMSAGGEVSTSLESEINRARGGGQPLVPELQRKMGEAMGSDFSGVRVHTDGPADALNQSVGARAFTTGQDLFFKRGEYQPRSRGGQELIAHELTHVVQQNGGAVQRQVEQNSTSINTNSAFTQSLQRKFDPSVIAMLEKHIGSKASQQKLVAGNKHGQGMAEELARGGDGGNENVNNFTAGNGQYYKSWFDQLKSWFGFKSGWKKEKGGAVGEEATPEVMSQTLMNLVRLTKYDDTASASVLELANGGQDLQDEQMWNLIVVNSKFMSYIVEGMTINKIISDSTIKTILEVKHTYVPKDGPASTSVFGSVAHEKNYDQGLTGEEATANFGLDYGGYQAGTLKADGTMAKADAHSSYVYDTAADDKGRTLKAVPNVFYMKIAIPENKLADVKVPVHGNVKSWAENKLLDIQTTIGDPVLLQTLAEKAGAKDSGQMLTSLSKKIEILTQFIARAKVDQGMLTTLTADQKKNKEDPLTNMGMAKPSSRLQTAFGTINQEYHIGRMNVPEGSGLWLKDSTGVDILVGQFIPNPANSNTVEWGNLKKDLIEAKLSENEALRNKTK